ncbi:hypothetical protein [Nonomuraea endophytica]|uniref:Uncharacterized protein n=1 Tax=Nonomuraea endophytica TaxID=714136 RepID=A0A7W8AAN4_9ACTN|nr:hypothetical protein [Nonomuraea endophytica]MBB5081318.1 hypothetical protein [Nonomuraea endophytica]
MTSTTLNPPGEQPPNEDELDAFIGALREEQPAEQRRHPYLHAPSWRGGPALGTYGEWEYERERGL